MRAAGIVVGVVLLELLARLLAVDDYYFLCAGDGLGHLHQKDGFSGVRSGKDEGDFAFDEHAVVVVLGVGLCLSIVDPFVGGLETESAELARCVESLFHLSFDGFDRIRVGCVFHAMPSSIFLTSISR